MKIIYFDTETTGLDPIKNDILTIGGIIEINATRELFKKLLTKIEFKK